MDGGLDGGIVLEPFVDEFDAGHNGGVVTGEETCDFHVGEVELFAAEVHGDLSRCGVFLGLRPALEVGKMDVEMGSNSS